MTHPAQPHCLHLENGHLAADTPVNFVQDLIDRWNHSVGPQRDTLLLHVHGGLVKEKAGRKSADALLQAYGGLAFPVFFIWESGLLETPVNNSDELLEDVKNAFGTILSAALNEAQAQGGQRTKGAKAATTSSKRHTATSPLDLSREKEIYQRLTADAGFQSLQAKFEHSLSQAQTKKSSKARAPSVVEVVSSQPLLVSRHLITHDAKRQKSLSASKKGVKGLPLPQAISMFVQGVAVVAASLQRGVEARDHGFFETVLEEALRVFWPLSLIGDAGRWLWKTMKQDTLDAFHPGHGGTVFVQALAAELTRRKVANEPAPRIVLSAHSAGAQFVCHFLDAAAEHLPDTKFEVIFYAPACRCDVFEQTLSQHRHRLKAFKMFTMTDQAERRNSVLVDALPAQLQTSTILRWCLERAYSASLLYMVSGVFEPNSDTPLLGLDRHVGPNKSRGTVHLPGVQTSGKYVARATVWSPTHEGPPGEQASALTHGGFPDDPLVRDSVQIFLSRDPVIGTKAVKKTARKSRSRVEKMVRKVLVQPLTTRAVRSKSK